MKYELVEEASLKAKIIKASNNLDKLMDEVKHAKHEKAASYSRLAGFYYGKGKYELACEFYDKAIAIEVFQLALNDLRQKKANVEKRIRHENNICMDG